MLVHCTQKVSVQQEIHNQIQSYLDEIRFLYSKDDSSFKKSMQNLWDKDYVQTTRKIDDEIEIHDFEAIWKNCQNVIDHLQMVLENSASEDRLSYEEKFWGIVVGGNTLSRGLTLEGLISSYFVRTSNYYDSLMQMGRWFGYRRGYLDLIRVYMTEDLKERFFHLANVENEIRDEIHTMAENGDRPIDVGVRIRSHPGMTVTNAMKMRSAATNRVSYSSSKVQPTYHNLSVEGLRKNQHAVQSLYSNVQAYGGVRTVSKFSRFQGSFLFRGVSSEVILQFLDDFEFSPANIRFSAEKISDYITQIGEAGELNDWSVAFVSKVKASEYIQLASGAKLGLSDRSIADGLVSELDRDARYVARVATPIDEFVDMGDLVQNCPSDVDEFTMIEGIKRGVGYLRKRYRPKNRGLLLIYAINPDSQLDERTSSSSPYPLVPLKAPEVVFSACFVFPETASDRGTVNYVVNRSIGITPIRRETPLSKPKKEAPNPLTVPQFEGREDATAKVVQLSKSRFQAGLQCPKRLFLECYHYDDRDNVNSAQEAIFEMGQEVGHLAQKRFPGGHLVDFDAFHQKEANEETKSLLEDPSITTIYEAAFTHDNIKIRVDILTKVGQGEVDLIEVKSSTRVKDEHHTDLAVQVYVVEGSGLKVRRCFLMHIDSSYEYQGGKYDIEKLFALDDMTNEVKDLQDTIEEQVAGMWSILQKREMPEVDTGSQCNKPYQCSFHSYCRKDWPVDHVSILPRASEKLLANLKSMSISRISGIPDSFTGLTSQQKRVRDSVCGGTIFYGRELLESLRSLEKPIFFIDFETINPALPIYANTRPFQQVPFQWSAHAMLSNDNLEHFEFLAEGSEDPRPHFIRALIKILGQEGPILVYSSFEKTCLNSIASDYPEYANSIENICSRMVDLLALIRNFFYHPAFEGSFSIKKVLPALVPELSYKNLAIGNGATAAMSFGRIARGNADANEALKIRQDLLEYCKLDTFAMVKVFEQLLSPNLAKHIVAA
jgi:CRISPR/Cas system-associated exonuclease Cas4 (RecB family)